jgi:hypothetical protein
MLVHSVYRFSVAAEFGMLLVQNRTSAQTSKSKLLCPPFKYAQLKLKLVENSKQHELYMAVGCLLCKQTATSNQHFAKSNQLFLLKNMGHI